MLNEQKKNNIESYLQHEEKTYIEKITWNKKKNSFRKNLHK